MAQECPRGKETMHRRNGKQGWKSPTSLTQQNNFRINHVVCITDKGKQKIIVGQEWFPLSKKYELLTLEDNENIANHKEARSKANS